MNFYIKFALSILFLSVLVFGQTAFSQTYSTIPHPESTQSFQQLSDIPKLNKIYRMSDKVRAELIKATEINLLRVNLRRILPADIHFEGFAGFLKNKDTILIRIFPDKKCDEGKVVNVAEIERCADAIPIRGGASFYSFRNQTNLKEEENWTDIHFADGKFSV